MSADKDDWRTVEERLIDELRAKVEGLEIACRVAEGKLADARPMIIQLQNGAIEADDDPHHATLSPSRVRKALNNVFNALYPAEAKQR